jgi:hypothetical protein
MSVATENDVMSGGDKNTARRIQAMFALVFRKTAQQDTLASRVTTDKKE